MIEKKGNIFESDCSVICITTNGIVKNNGEAVMGAGVALCAKNIFPNISLILGKKIKEKGNHVFNLGNFFYNNKKFIVISFPTKNHWKDKSELYLIKQSILELVKIQVKEKWKKVGIVRPGCCNGKLKWNNVKPYLDNLSDNFIVFHL